MFIDIVMSNYFFNERNCLINYELQQSYFLRDCLKEEIYYELKDSNIIIYKKLKNGILEEISLDELIFYIHTYVAMKIRDEQVAIQAERLQSQEAKRRMRHKELREHSKNCEEDMKRQSAMLRAQGTFINIFQSIDNIKKSVENMKIILKYDNYDDCDSCDESESENGNSENDEKNKDHKSLAF